MKARATELGNMGVSVRFCPSFPVGSGTDFLCLHLLILITINNATYVPFGAVIKSDIQVLFLYLWGSNELVIPLGLYLGTMKMLSVLTPRLGTDFWDCPGNHLWTIVPFC